MEGCVIMGYSFVNAVELYCIAECDGFAVGQKYIGYINEGMFETTDDNGVYRQAEMSYFTA